MKRIMLVIAAVLLPMTIAFAQNADTSGGEFGARFFWWRDQNIVQQLQLTDDQTARLNEIDYATRQSNINLRAQENSAKLELLRQLNLDTPSEPAVRDAVNRLNRSRSDMMNLIMIAQVRARLVLTLDQRKKLKQLLGG